jgi:hypothetical protein
VTYGNGFLSRCFSVSGRLHNCLRPSLVGLSYHRLSGSSSSGNVVSSLCLGGAPRGAPHLVGKVAHPIFTREGMKDRAGEASYLGSQLRLVSRDIFFLLLWRSRQGACHLVDCVKGLLREPLKEPYQREHKIAALLCSATPPPTHQELHTSNPPPPSKSSHTGQPPGPRRL